MADNRTTYKFEGDAAGLIKASKKVDGALGKVTKEAKKTDNALETLETQTHKTAAGEVVLATTSGTAAVGMMALAGAAGAAALAIAAVAAILVIIVAALTVVAAAFIATAYGVHKLITAADELYKEMEPLYELGALEAVDEKQLKAIKEYTANWEALKAVFKDLMISVAGNLAIDLENISFEILVISIYLSDLAKDWLKINSIIRESIIKFLISPIEDLQDFLMGVLLLYKPVMRGMEAIGVLSAGTWDSIAEGIAGLDEKARGLAETLVDKGYEYLSGQLSGLTSGMGDARKKAEKLKEGMKQLADEAEGASEALEEVNETIDEFDAKEWEKFLEQWAQLKPVTEQLLSLLAFQDTMSGLGEITVGLMENMTDLTDPTGVFRDSLVEVAEIFETLGEADLGSLTGSLEAAADIAGSVGSMIQKVIQRQLDGSDELTKKQKANLKVLFALQQAAAISSIIIDTALAAMKAYAMFGPPPSPVGIAASAGVIAIGAAQVAAVASQKPPFHIGGIIPAAPGKQGVMINALPGESVLNREATAGLGAEGVSALNSGSGMGGGVTIEMVYKHRIFDNFVSDNISKGGPLRNAIKSGRRVGHRSRG